MTNPGESSKELSHFVELEKLASLRDKGIISEEEFTAKKRQLLGLDTPSPVQPLPFQTQSVGKPAGTIWVRPVRPQKRGSRIAKGILIFAGSVFGLFILLLIVSAIASPGTPRIQSPSGPGGASTASLETLKASARGDVSYDELARYSDRYVGQWVMYTGKVIQTMESFGKITAMRVAVSQVPSSVQDNVIFLSSDYSGPRILENDLITFWGPVKGLRSYSAVLGNQITIPEVEAKFIEVAAPRGGGLEPTAIPKSSSKSSI